VLWIFWITRNKFAIEGVYPNAPSDIVYKILSYLQQWRVLLKGGDQSAMDDKEQEARVWLAQFQERLTRTPNEEML
jgi:hypothetical protein